MTIRHIITTEPPLLSSSSSTNLISPENLKSSSLSASLYPHFPTKSRRRKKTLEFAKRERERSMSLTIPTNLVLNPRSNKSLSQSLPKSTARFVCSDDKSTPQSMKAFSAAVALSSILLSAPMPAVADISGLTPCKESKQFAKREKQQIKKLESSLKLYAPESAPALALNAQIEKTKRRFVSLLYTHSHSSPIFESQLKIL